MTTFFERIKQDSDPEQPTILLTRDHYKRVKELAVHRGVDLTQPDWLSEVVASLLVGKI